MRGQREVQHRVGNTPTKDRNGVTLYWPTDTLRITVCFFLSVSTTRVICGRLSDIGDPLNGIICRSCKSRSSNG
jgi:hypothetical protein